MVGPTPSTTISSPNQNTDSKNAKLKNLSKLLLRLSSTYMIRILFIGISKPKISSSTDLRISN